jgi:peptide/nickel transport system substrate-binding protein
MLPKPKLKTLLKTALAAALATTAMTGLSAAQELKVGVQNMAPWLDPGRDFSNVGSQFYFNAFDPLIGKDATRAESVWQPGIATSWKQISPTEIELKIRQGVTFHNGEPMTAEDIVFSFDRIINSTFPPYTVRKRDTLPNMAKVEAVDAETIRVTATKPEPLFETLLNVQQGMIVPKKYIMVLTGDPNVAEAADFEAFALKPIGTGPYKIAEFIPNQRLVYERHDGFWGEKAPFQKVTVTRIPELSGRLTALKNAEVDLITNIPPDQLEPIASDAKLKVEGMQTPLFHVVIFNTQNPKMANPKLRQALSYAIDRKTLNEALWFGKAKVPTSHTFAQFGPLDMPELNTFEYDPAKAKALLKEAGYDGFPIRYDIQAAYYTNGLLAAQAIQEMWGAVGVKTQLNVTEQWTGSDPTMMARGWSNPMYFPDPAGAFGIMWAPTGNSASEGRFKANEAYIALWEKFRFSTDLAERKQAYTGLMQAIKNDPPVLPLYQPYESYGMKSSLAWRPLPGHIPYVLDFRAGRVTLAAR